MILAYNISLCSCFTHNTRPTHFCHVAPVISINSTFTSVQLAKFFMNIHCITFIRGRGSLPTKVQGVAAGAS